MSGVAELIKQLDEEKLITNVEKSCLLTRMVADALEKDIPGSVLSKALYQVVTWLEVEIEKERTSDEEPTQET